MTPDPPKKTQRIWAIWKSSQNCIGGRSPPSPPCGGANDYDVMVDELKSWIIVKFVIIIDA